VNPVLASPDAGAFVRSTASDPALARPASKACAMPWRCWLGRHDLLITLRRTADGVLIKPVIIVWVCARCGRRCGTSCLAVAQARRP